jgi:hypothetical protein
MWWKVPGAKYQVPRGAALAEIANRETSNLKENSSRRIPRKLANTRSAPRTYLEQGAFIFWNFLEFGVLKFGVSRHSVASWVAEIRQAMLIAVD